MGEADPPGAEARSLAQARSFPRAARLFCLLVPAAMVAVSLGLLGMRVVMRRFGWDPPPADALTNLSMMWGVKRLDGADSWGAMLLAKGWLAANPVGDVYRRLFFQDHLKFLYPLPSLLFVDWLPSGFRRADLALNLMNLAAYLAGVVGMVLLTLRLGDAMLEAPVARNPSNRAWLAAAAVIGAICFFPFVRALAIGQIQVVLDGFFIWACWAYLSRRPLLAGLLIGAAALIKPQMGLFLAWGLVRRDGRFLLGLALTAGAGCLVTALAYGWAWPIRYLGFLSFVGEHGETFFPNQSVNGLVNRLLGNGPSLVWDFGRFAPYNPVTYAATLASSAALIAAALWAALRARSHLAAMASMTFAGVCFTVASPVAWDHHYGVMLPAFAVCFLSVAAARPGEPRRWRLLAGLFFVAANSFAAVNLLAGTPLNLLQSYLLFAALGLLAYMAWLLPAPRACLAGAEPA